MLWILLDFLSITHEFLMCIAKNRIFFTTPHFSHFHVYFFEMTIIFYFLSIFFLLDILLKLLLYYVNNLWIFYFFCKNWLCYKFLKFFLWISHFLYITTQMYLRTCLNLHILLWFLNDVIPTFINKS